MRIDERALEFIVEYTSRTPAARDKPPQHLRMFTRSEFNLWREALEPKITNRMGTQSKPSAVLAAQKWLAHAEAEAASYSSAPPNE